MTRDCPGQTDGGGCAYAEQNPSGSKRRLRVDATRCRSKAAAAAERRVGRHGAAARRARDPVAHYRTSRHDRIRTPAWPTPLLKSLGSPNISTLFPGANIKC